ncbi:MAG: tetratricopeptide repeat protein [Syntrophaceae bacterium]|nr:tetratricopeptide repeat protein [Syntrophaceae bacterium]HQM90376.1 tetratricopeptide repeat protein [Syntrophales bacterium]
MDEAIVRERASEISRTLGSCRKFIHQGKVYACLSGFKDVLEKMLVTRMLPQDEKDLQEGINEFQRQLMSSAAFRNAFGPVTFQDNDNETSLAFIRQLVNVSEEEIAANLAGGNESPENRALMIMRIIDKGEHEKARALIGNNEDLLCFILQTYNARGIQARREGSYGKAVEELKKALSVAPDDEGILYNLARAYAAKKEKKPAVESIRKALQINPAFAEARTLLNHLQAG